MTHQEFKSPSDSTKIDKEKDSFEIRCPRCGTKIQVGIREVNQPYRCRVCTHEFLIPMTNIRPGLVLSNYWVQHYLGSGSISDLFLCKRTHDNEQVVLKVLTPVVNLDEQRLEKYLIHFCRAYQISLPNLITPYETGKIRGQTYLAFPYVDARPLHQIIKEDGVFPEKQALIVALKVARILRYAWQNHRIIHGNLKPSNILINDAGEVYLSDFGNNKFLLLGEGESLELLNFDQKIHLFLAPEQKSSSHFEEYPGIDIYSLGLTLFFMLTGKFLTVKNTDTSRVLNQYQEGSPTRHPTHPRISRKTIALLKLMLARDPHRRLQSWQQVIKEIKQIIKQHSHSDYTADILNSPKALNLPTNAKTSYLSSDHPLRTFLILASIVTGIGILLAILIVLMNR